MILTIIFVGDGIINLKAIDERRSPFIFFKMVKTNHQALSFLSGRFYGDVKVSSKGRYLRSWRHWFRIVGMAASFKDFQVSELLQPDFKRIFYGDVIRIYIYILIITMGFITQQYVNWYIWNGHPRIGILKMWLYDAICIPIIPSGELTFCHGKSPFFMGKSTISMAIFHCYVSSPGRVFGRFCPPRLQGGWVSKGELVRVINLINHGTFG